jgi:hypothetical protein
MLYLCALIFLGTDNTEQAVAKLSEAIDIRPDWVDLAKHDLGFEEVKDDPSFLALIGLYD